MYEQLDARAYWLRIVASILLVLIVVFLITTLLTAFGSVSASAADDTPTISSTLSDDPNVVSLGLGSMMAELGQAADSTAQSTLSGIGSATASTTDAVAHGGTVVANGLGKGTAAAAQGTVNTVGFIIRAPGNTIGFIARATGLNHLIQPKTDSQIPVIDPNAAVFHTSSPDTKNGSVPAAPQDNAPFSWPIHGQITTLFGVPHWPYQPTHSGLDISSGQRSGVTGVKPIKSGTVVDVVHSDRGLGNYVIIDHGSGISSVYGHMASTQVEKGQNVTRDSVIGFEGSTGASTGPHVHLEVRVNGQPVDPLQYIGSQPH